jgi:hypothetical protein
MYYVPACLEVIVPLRKYSLSLFIASYINLSQSYFSRINNVYSILFQGLRAVFRECGPTPFRAIFSLLNTYSNMLKKWPEMWSIQPPPQ